MPPTPANTKAPLPEDTVRLAYELMLGRKVESEQTLANFRKLGDVPALRKAMLGSVEFGNLNGSIMMGRWQTGLANQPSNVSVKATPEQLDQLFARIQGQWTKLGETDPHWSVLTNDVYKAENFAKHEEGFYKSGQIAMALLDCATKRGGVELKTSGTVLELGCGTGRVTHLLADRFGRVEAADVSPGNLSICEAKLGQMGKKNVDFVLLKSPKDIEKLPPLDLFFSTIVLQHNPPPVMHYFLDAILGKIQPGGAVFFQVPTHRLGYSFDVAKYLTSPETTMEMHCLPMHEVFALFSKHGLRPVEVLMDGMTGFLGSHTFLAVRE